LPARLCRAFRRRRLPSSVRRGDGAYDPVARLDDPEGRRTGVQEIRLLPEGDGGRQVLRPEASYRERRGPCLREPRLDRGGDAGRLVLRLTEPGRSRRAV